MRPSNSQAVDFRPLNLDRTKTQRPNVRRAQPNSRQGQNVPSQPPQRMLRQVTNRWDNWPEIAVKLSNLRQDETTFNISRNFEHFGNIAWVEIYETQDGRKDSRGKIKFTAPVLQHFWQAGEFRMKNVNDSSAYKIKVELIEYKGKFMHQSTIRPHIFYPQVMHMFPSRLRFGIMIEENSMMPLQTLHPLRKPEDLRFTVDVFRKRFTTQFKILNNDPRHHPGSDFVSDKPTGLLDRENIYKFQIPFDQLKEIRLVEAANGTFKFIISLDSPPMFNRKREESKDTHDADALTWSEFDDGWFRQTDIVYDPYSLTRVPVALHKDRAVIDIGMWLLTIPQCAMVDPHSVH